MDGAWKALYGNKRKSELLDVQSNKASRVGSLQHLALNALPDVLPDKPFHADIYKTAADGRPGEHIGNHIGRPPPIGLPANMQSPINNWELPLYQDTYNPDQAGRMVTVFREGGFKSVEESAPGQYVTYDYHRVPSGQRRTETLPQVLERTDPWNWDPILWYVSSSSAVLPPP